MTILQRTTLELQKSYLCQQRQDVPRAGPTAPGRLVRAGRKPCSVQAANAEDSAGTWGVGDPPSAARLLPMARPHGLDQAWGLVRTVNPKP